MDKSMIMKRAWELTRRFEGNGQTLHQRLSRALSIAWYDAKQKAKQERETAAHFAAMAAIPQEQLDLEVRMLENSDANWYQYQDRLAHLKIEQRRRMQPH